jgi:SAM-dependent methyltransferase
MKNYTESTYGEQIASIYDELYSFFDKSAISTLSELARGGHALELGIGTGRIALPLQQSGVDISGIDASEAMIAKLRAKPSSKDIEVSIGNFADLDVEGNFELIYVVFNTFFALETQEEQVRCFKNVAQHLAVGGVFVIEAFVPDMARFADHQTVRATAIDEAMVHLEVTRIDMASQQIFSQHTLLSEEGVRLFPVKIRYAWPSELDLMAQLAGLSLQHRWGNWTRDEFTKESRSHISVYGHTN